MEKDKRLVASKVISFENDIKKHKHGSDNSTLKSGEISQGKMDECSDTEQFPQGLKSGYRIPKLKPKVRKDSSRNQEKDKYDRSSHRYLDESYKHHRNRSKSSEKTKSGRHLSHGHDDDRYVGSLSSRSEKDFKRHRDLNRKSEDMEKRQHHNPTSKHDKQYAVSSKMESQIESQGHEKIVSKRHRHEPDEKRRQRETLKSIISKK